MKRRGSARQRGYDSRWERARLVFINQHPLCAECERNGLVTVGREVDHIIPHKGDQTLFWDEANWQTLCHECHSRKTAMEDGGFGGASNHPSWLPTPGCPVVLVTGPPGSGKTTYCKLNAKAPDVIIDLDDCFEAVCGVHGHEADRQYLNAAIRYRNSLLASLQRKRDGRVYLIVASPTDAEVAWWMGKMGPACKHVRLDPGFSVCAGRLPESRLFGLQRWYREKAANQWANKDDRPTIGADGWPTTLPQG
jgi:hypothetical protein